MLGLKTRILKYFLLLLIWVTAPLYASLHSIAFYYGTNPPFEELHAFDVAVIGQPELVDPKQYDDANSQAFAYISVGETDKKPKGFKDSWIIGTNPAWKSDVVDLANPQWRAYYIKHVFAPLWEKGYRGFFLDTLDSYYLAPKANVKKQQAGLVALIKEIKKRYPDAKLIFNRGFEVLPELHQDAYAVAAESLFKTWNQAAGKYADVSQENRTYVLTQFDKIKKWGIPVISIDYLPAKDRTEAKKVAQQISSLGIIPWIGNAELTNLGVGAVTLIPRKILIFYDTPTPISPGLLNASYPLEYLGYVPELHSIYTDLPDEPLTGRYAGIILWASTTDPKVSEKMYKWLNYQREQGIPILFLGGLDFLFNANSLMKINLKKDWDLSLPGTIAPYKMPKLQISYQAPDIGYEFNPYPVNTSFSPMKTYNSDVLLKITDNYNQSEDAVAITPWGGYALYPFVVMSFPNGMEKWVVNPLTFFQKTLRLKSLPAPDTTTEYGRRLMMVHIDGDGYSSVAEWPGGKIAAEELKDKVLLLYKIPTDVSIVQASIGPTGLYPEESPELMKVAKEIFALPWVEMATHTYSHPFDWHKIETVKRNGIYNLPVTPSYHYNINAEITGSVEFINKYLAPKGKKCHLIFWSGQANLNEKILKVSYEDHLNNINGYANPIQNHYYSMAMLSPLGVYYGKYFQVFATTANEDNYTNLWGGPYYGFNRVIQAFELTNKPIRTRPIDIYYHFYSATKIGALKALKQVYDWALTQPVFNAYEMDYTNIVMDFNRTTLANNSTGGIVIRNHNDLREVRWPQADGYPDLSKSTNIVGYSPYGKDYYIHLGPLTQSTLYFTNQKPTEPYIYDANAKVMSYSHKNNGFDFELKGYLPVSFSLANVTNCLVFQDNEPLKGQFDKVKNITLYNLKGTDSHVINVRCG